MALALILDLTCRDSAFVDAVLYAAFPIAMLASEIPSARRRAGFVGVLGCVLAVIAMYAAFVGVVLFADRI